MLGETKLVPPRKGKNANYLSIKHVYLRVARGDFLERMGQQFLNYAGGAPKLYINRLGLLPDTHVASYNYFLIKGSSDLLFTMSLRWAIISRAIWNSLR